MRCGSRILDGARGYERAIGRWLAGLLSCLMQEVRPLAPQRQEGHRGANGSADGNGSNRRPRKLPNEGTTSQVNSAPLRGNSCRTCVLLRQRGSAKNLALIVR